MRQRSLTRMPADGWRLQLPPTREPTTPLPQEMALTQRDENAEEERLVTLGTDALGRLLVVVYE